jgi:hypothetical protein
MRTRATFKIAAIAIATIYFLEPSSIPAQDAEDGILKMTLTNKLAEPIDVFIVDENEDPPTETYKATLAPPKKSKVRGKETIVDNPQTLDTYAGSRWRLMLHKPKPAATARPGTTAKPNDVPKRAKPDDLLPLYDYVATEAADQKHIISKDDFLLRRLGIGTEIVLVGEQGVLLADDNPTPDFGPATNRTGQHLRQRESSLLDLDSKHRNYRWIVQPANNGKADAVSLLLKLDGEESRVYLVSAPDNIACPGYLCAEAPAPADPDSEEGQRQIAEFNEATSFFMRPDKNDSQLGTPIHLDRSDERNYDESFKETVESDEGKTVITYDASTRTETRVFTGNNGSFKREQNQIPKLYKFNRFLAIPWGDSKTAGSLETLALLGTKIDSGESWKKADSPLNDTLINEAAAASAKDVATARDQVASALLYCRSGYHQVKMNPLNLRENGLVANQGNQIFASKSDTQPGNFWVFGNYRVPVDFFLQDAKELKVKEQTRMYDTDEELTDISASSWGIDLSGTVTTTVGGGFNVGVFQANASVANQMNYSFGYGSSFGRTVSNQAGEQKTTVVKTKWNSKYYLILNREYAVLSNPFRQALLDLANATSTRDFDNFFNKYGTHYPIATLMGGRASKQGSIENKSTKSFVKTDGGYNWSAGIGAIGKGTNDTSNSSTKSRVDEVQNWDESAFGGQGGTFDAWSAGDHGDVVPIKVYLRPIWQLVVADLLFEKPVTQADCAMASALQSIVTKEWFRHLSPEGTGAPRKRQDDSAAQEDYFGIILDSFEFKCDRPNEFKTWSVTGALKGEALLLDDLSPLKQQSRRPTLPAQYIRDRKELTGFNQNQMAYGYGESTPVPESHKQLKPTPMRAMFSLPKQGGASPDLGAFAVRLTIYNTQGAFVTGGNYNPDASFNELETLIHVEGRNNSPWEFLQRYDTMHLEPSQQTRLLGGKASYPGTFVKALPDEQNGLNFVFISSPIGKLREGKAAVTDYWPGRDEAAASLMWTEQSQVNPEYDEGIGPRKSAKLIPVFLKYRVQVGLLSDVNEKQPNPPIDAGMPVVQALESRTNP